VAVVRQAVPPLLLLLEDSLLLPELLLLLKPLLELELELLLCVVPLEEELLWVVPLELPDWEPEELPTEMEPEELDEP
jgi:hypothetical protein